MFRMVVQIAILMVFAIKCQAAIIQVVPPSEPQSIFGTASKIFIDGEFNKDTPKQLEQIINAKNIQDYSDVFLNSPGGNLLAGMDLGRVIRKHRFNTSVAIAPTPPSKLEVPKAGICFSACTLAYMGGVFRFMDKSSRFGVHRFYSDRTTGNDSDIAQMLSAVEVSYLREMGIEVDFFSAMVSSGKNAVYEPSRAELERSLVVNNGVTSPKWSIESTGDSLYFKGERQTSFGVNKFIILCEKRHLSLYAIFDPQGRETEVMNFGANSLVIDGQRSPISPLSERIQNHWFNGFYNLTPAQWNSISNAKTVGITRQMTYESPIFLGFDSMPISDGKPKLIGFMRGCR